MSRQAVPSGFQESRSLRVSRPPRPSQPDGACAWRRSNGRIRIVKNARSCERLTRPGSQGAARFDNTRSAAWLGHRRGSWFRAALRLLLLRGCKVAGSAVPGPKNRVVASARDIRHPTARPAATSCSWTTRLRNRHPQRWWLGLGRRGKSYVRGVTAAPAQQGADLASLRQVLRREKAAMPSHPSRDVRRAQESSRWVPHPWRCRFHPRRPLRESDSRVGKRSTGRVRRQLRCRHRVHAATAYPRSCVPSPSTITATGLINGGDFARTKLRQLSQLLCGRLIVAWISVPDRGRRRDRLSVRTSQPCRRGRDSWSGGRRLCTRHLEDTFTASGAAEPPPVAPHPRPAQGAAPLTVQFSAPTDRTRGDARPWWNSATGTPNSTAFHPSTPIRTPAGYTASSRERRRTQPGAGTTPCDHRRTRRW